MENPRPKTVIKKEDIDRVIVWMMKWACGYKNARNRKEIINCLMMEDRYFREVCSTIPEIITSSQEGYYIMPLVDKLGDEVRHAREIVEGEDRRRIVSQYLRYRRQKAAIAKLAMSREEVLL